MHGDGIMNDCTFQEVHEGIWQCTKCHYQFHGVNAPRRNCSEVSEEDRYQTLLRSIRESLDKDEASRNVHDINLCLTQCLGCKHWDDSLAKCGNWPFHKSCGTGKFGRWITRAWWWCKLWTHKPTQGEFKESLIDAATMCRRWKVKGSDG